MRSNRRGFTMPELALTMVVMAILGLMAFSRAGRAMNRHKVDRAASVVAADMEQAFSIAGRLRRPVNVTFDATARSYTVTDVNGGAVRLFRSLGPDAPYGLTAFTTALVGPGSPTVLTIMPPGRSNARLDITLTTGDKSRQIVVSTAGFVRIQP